MRISTTLNTLNPDESAGGYSAFAAVNKLCDAGFQALDIPFFKYASVDLDYGATPFFSDQWAQWAEKLGTLAADRQIIFNQSHNLTFNFFDPDEKTALLNACVDRAILINEMLGIKNTVLHPIAPRGYEYDSRKSKECNTAYFRRKAEFAADHGVNILLENMLSNRKFDGQIVKRYCDNPYELAELVEAINMPNVQICFDVGHAHYMSGDVCADLMVVKDHVQGLHIHDNDRWNDEHLLPFQGTIPWEKLCRTLAGIHYAGDFTLEIALCISRMPKEIQHKALLSAYETAEYLVSRINAANLA